MQEFFLLCKLAALKLLSVMSHYYTLYSLSVFSLAKSLQLILEITATYRLVSYLVADNWLICRLRTQCMLSNNNINLGSLQRCVCRYFFIKTMYNKTVIRYGFWDILNNEGPGKCHQPRPSAWLITLTPRPWLFGTSQKPHPIIIIYNRRFRIVIGETPRQEGGEIEEGIKIIHLAVRPLQGMLLYLCGCTN